MHPAILFINMYDLVLRRNGFICITLFIVFVSEPVGTIFAMGHLALTVI